MLEGQAVQISKGPQGVILTQISQVERSGISSTLSHTHTAPHSGFYSSAALNSEICAMENFSGSGKKSK